MEAARETVCAAITAYNAKNSEREDALFPLRRVYAPVEQQDTALRALCSDDKVVVIKAPRRFGKTVAAAIACIVFDVAHGGGSTVAVFCVSDGACAVFAEALSNAMRVTDSAPFQMAHCEDGHRRFVFASLGDPSRKPCTVNIYATDAKIFKGVVGDLVICDEVGPRSGTDVFVHVVVPLMATAERTAVLYTPGDDDNDAFLGALGTASARVAVIA
jgi:hypothetical protein